MPYTTTTPRSLAVLLVEDVPANQRLVTSILQSHAHQVTVANDGREAIDYVLAGDFDVVLMDVQMPVMDGYQATEAIRSAERSSGKHVPIIAMTSNATGVDRERCRTAGMDAYLAKPIDISELVEVIDRCGSGHALRPGTSAVSSKPANANESDQALNFDDAMKRLHGDRELFREFVQVFDEDAPRLIRDLHEALAASDATKLNRAAHSLRGLAVNLGADRVQRVAAELESQGDNADLLAASQTLVRLMTAFEALNRSLAEFR